MWFRKSNQYKLEKPRDEELEPKPAQANKLRYIFIGSSVFIALLLIICGFVIFKHFSRKNNGVPSTASKSSSSSSAAQNQTTVRLIATGDTIAHDAINQEAKKPDGSYDYYPILKNMQPFFDKSDVRFCNQAVPGGGPSFGISGYPVFNSPFEVADGLQRLGCNVINTGTNHTFDKGQPVINSWLDHWASLPNVLAVAGANRSADEQKAIRYFSSKGVKFAFLSYVTYSNTPPANAYGVNMFDRDKASAQLREARAKADIVLVSMRWGTEYSSSVNASQKSDAQFLADNGADIIFGHGSHVFQPVEHLKGAAGHDTLVWYSLGNFMSAQLQIEALMNGIAVMDIDVPTKKIREVKLMPIYMHYEWTAEQKAKEDLLSRHNFVLFPLDKATKELTVSQNNTTVEAQRNRLAKLLEGSGVNLITSDQY